MNLIHLLMVSAVFAYVNCSYAGTLVLTQTTFSRNINRTVPHIANSTLIAVIRDIDSVSKFSWNMTYELLKETDQTDIVTFHFLYAWPTGRLNSMTIDYLILQTASRVKSLRLPVDSYQTHLEPSYIDQNNPHVLLLYPVGFSDFELASKFSYMLIPQYKMFAIHYMHETTHNMRDDNVNMHTFDGKDEWLEFQCVLVETPLKSNPNCITLDKYHVKPYQHFNHSDECAYFGGLKSIYKYRSKGEMFINDSIVAFKDYVKTDFGVSAFPIPKAGFIDNRTFSLVPEFYDPLDTSLDQIPAAAEQDYWFVVYILGAGVTISACLMIFAHIAVNRRQRYGDRQHLVGRKSAQTVEMSSGVIPCSVCGKRIEGSSSETSFVDRPVCESCKIEELND